MAGFFLHAECEDHLHPKHAARMIIFYLLFCFCFCFCYSRSISPLHQLRLSTSSPASPGLSIIMHLVTCPSPLKLRPCTPTPPLLRPNKSRSFLLHYPAPSFFRSIIIIPPYEPCSNVFVPVLEKGIVVGDPDTRTHIHTHTRARGRDRRPSLRRVKQ